MTLLWAFLTWWNFWEFGTGFTFGSAKGFAEPGADPEKTWGGLCPCWVGWELESWKGTECCICGTEPRPEAGWSWWVRYEWESCKLAAGTWCPVTGFPWCKRWGPKSWKGLYTSVGKWTDCCLCGTEPEAGCPWWVGWETEYDAWYPWWVRWESVTGKLASWTRCSETEPERSGGWGGCFSFPFPLSLLEPEFKSRTWCSEAEWSGGWGAGITGGLFGNTKAWPSIWLRWRS